MRDAQSLYFAGTIQRLEAQARTTQPGIELMERAGLAAAQRARDLLGVDGRAVLLLAGPGNNGGDAFVVARHLREWSYQADVLFTGDAQRLPADARRALQALQDQGGPLPQRKLTAQHYDLIVDGLFGTGLRRALEEPYAALIARVEQLGAPVLALDLPSGINADTGQVMGCALHAHHTVTFIALKPGLLTLDGPDYRGELTVDTLGLDAPTLVPADGYAIGATHLHGVLPPRLKNSHKGTFGSVAVIGGGKGMVGAALLAGRAALHAGAGRVYAGLLAPMRPGVDFLQPELMLRSAEEALRLPAPLCLALGPGMGTSEDAVELMRNAVLTTHAMVIDADALNIIALDANVQRTLLARRAPTLMTPHPAEAARLLNIDTATVQSNRVESALRIANCFRSHVVLKGVGSVCATPEGHWYINPSGNPGLASAGMGDVLAGLLAALLAQGAQPEAALLAGVHLHGLAADMLVARDVGPRGLTASEVIHELRQLINLP
jgi:hydroxyethylthiazole kinase-like uncharacterized protein yjeF